MDGQSSSRGSSRCRGDGGAALVEFALVMPVLFLLLFGMVEFGLNLNDYEAVRQGVRDSARQAVVADYGSGSCAPVSATAAANSDAVRCTTKKAAGVSGLAVKVVFTDLNGATDFNTDKVKVCAQVKAKSITGIMAPFLTSVYLKSNVEMRAEKNLVLANSEDSPPSGGSWAWC